MAKSISNQLFSPELQQLIINGGHLKCEDFHDGTCLAAAFKRMLEIFQNSYKYYLPIYVVQLIVLQRKKLRQQPVSTLRKVALDFLKSVLFVSCYVAACNYTVCKVKNVRKAIDPWSPSLAGCLSSVFLLLEKPGRRGEITIFIMPKFLETAWRMLEKRHIVMHIDHWEFIVFGIAMGVINYYYVHDPKQIKPTYQAGFKALWS